MRTNAMRSRRGNEADSADLRSYFRLLSSAYCLHALPNRAIPARRQRVRGFLPEFLEHKPASLAAAPAANFRTVIKINQLFTR